LLEAFHRLFDPPHVEGERLLLISVGGFLLNLTGVIFFHGDAHGGDNDNMVGVYLHMLADLLGSVAVISSTLIIQFFGFHMADSICSILVSCLILLASYPLLTHSSAVLMQRTPSSDVNIPSVIEQIERMDGVVSVSNPHFWTISGNQLVGSMNLKVRADTNEQIMLKQVNDLVKQNVNVSNLTIEIKK